MKREIRFRAYSSNNHKMYPVSNIEWDIDGRIWVTADDGKNGIELIDEEAHLMQYTGLKDKNGRSIYEGDIVRYTAWHDGKPAGAIQGEVVYDGDLGMASFNILLDRDGKIDRAVLPAIGVEIMGNVYENQELLEGKQ